MIRQYFCKPCNVWFDAFTKRDAEGNAEKRTHSCGTLCESGIQGGTPARPMRGPSIRGGEWNSVPRDFRKVYQRYWGLTDNEMSKVTREQMDRDMVARGLTFVDASWDENKYGSKRERGETTELPPETEDPREVEAWNEKHLGKDFVQEQHEQIRAVFEQASAGTLEGLPRAEDVNVHDTPHLIDVEKTAETIAKMPVVEPERKRELAGRLVTG